MDEKQRFSWFLGIDISKETFDACCIPSHGERLFNLSASMDRKGFEELIRQLLPYLFPKSLCWWAWSQQPVTISTFILSLSL